MTNYNSKSQRSANFGGYLRSVNFFFHFYLFGTSLQLSPSKITKICF